MKFSRSENLNLKFLSYPFDIALVFPYPEKGEENIWKTPGENNILDLGSTEKNFRQVCDVQAPGCLTTSIRALYRGVCHTKVLHFRAPLYPKIAVRYTKYRFHFTIYTGKL